MGAQPREYRPLPVPTPIIAKGRRWPGGRERVELGKGKRKGDSDRGRPGRFIRSPAA